MNETLRRALIRAGLSEENVAAHLGVDPKTVRRWTEGRVPYLRHRWALAAMLGVDEADLWPQLRAAKTVPGEVKAVYPHLDGVPRQVWLRLFGSARREIGILDDNALFLAEDPGILGAVANRAQDGVDVRLCLADLGAPMAEAWCAAKTSGDTSTVSIRNALALFAPLRQDGNVEIRLHQQVLYNSIYLADRQLLVCQHAHGIPASQSPVLRLEQPESADMVTTYLESFERIWIDAQPLGRMARW